MAGLKTSGTDICAKTGLNKSELSKLSSGTITRITAAKFFSIYKAVEDEIKSDLKGMLEKAFQTITLVADWQNYVKNKKFENTSTPIGLIFLREENSRAILAAKTKITVNRLRELSNNSNAELLAVELYLFEKAFNKEHGTLFKELFEIKSFNTPDENSNIQKV